MRVIGLLAAGFVIGWGARALVEARRAYKVVEDFKRGRALHAASLERIHGRVRTHPLFEGPAPGRELFESRRDIDHTHDGRVWIDPLWELK